MASKVMTISRIFVLLWFTIFFETVRTTTPSAFTDADTSPYATETARTTTPSTFTDADTSPSATETVTASSTFTDADTSPHTTETVTTSSTSTDADTSPYTTGEAPTANPIGFDYKAYLILVSSVAGLIIFVMSVVIAVLVKSLRSRKSREQALYSNDSVQPENYGTIKDDEVTHRHPESALDSNDYVQSGNDDIFEDDEVPSQEKRPLSQKEVKDSAHTVTIRHCNKIYEVIKSCRRGEVVLINQKPYENEKVLFHTRKMIEDWLDRQKCSNYEKRQKLKAAIVSARSSAYSEHDKELFSAKVIKKRVSGDKSKRVAVAYDLLMTDIKPFAKELRVEDGELEKYDLRAGNPEHLEKGTIGLVTLLSK